MKKTLRLLKEYNEARGYRHGRFDLFDDGSGRMMTSDGVAIFHFKGKKNLHKKLKKATKKALR